MIYDRLQNKKILLTGATGMIGKELIRLLMDEYSGLEVGIVAMGRSEEKARQRLGNFWRNPRFSFIEHDINMPLGEKAAEIGHVDYVIHAASTTHPVAYATEPVETITVNVMGLHELLEYARTYDVERFVFLSSVEVYGENRGDTDKFREDYCGYIDCNTLRAGYPESKRLGEALCQAYRRQYGMDIVIPRLSRVYGPTMLASDSKAIAQFIKKAQAGEDIILKSAGNQLYSYCYAQDAAEGILAVLAEGTDGEAYNIADKNSEITLKELAEMIAGIAGTKVVFEIPDSTEQAGYSKATKALLDAGKTEKLGWQAKVGMREGLGRMIGKQQREHNSSN